MPSIDFEFRARGAAAVRRDLDSIRATAQRTGQAVAALSQGETRVLLNEIGKRQRARSKEAGDARANEARITSAAKDGARDRTRASESEADARAKAYAGIVRSTETTERQRTQIVDREARRRAALEARAQRESARQQRRQDRQREQDHERHQEILRGAATGVRNAVTGGARWAGRTAVNFGRNVAGAVGEYGDTVRERLQRAEGLTEAAQTIVSGDIGISGAAGQPVVRQILGAARRGAERGFNPEDVIEALSLAQSSDSALATESDRNTYINTVLPQLMSAAVATNSSLGDWVGTAREMRRQHGISLEDMPQRIAAMIVQSRSGSMGASGFARYGGVLGGAASAFMGSGGDAGRGAFATVGGLFQIASRAGGEAGQAATRTRSFLDNFVSARGQGRLHDLLGRNVLDATGQLRTNANESQSDALMRTIEEAYRRSGGNAERFLTGVAGRSTEARQLGQQLFNDMRRNNGSLVETRALVGAGRDATAAGTQDVAASDILGTEAAQRRIRENRAFYNAIQGPGGVTDNAFRQTQREMDALRETNPFIASLLDTTIARGGMDLVGLANTRSDPYRLINDQGQRTTRRDMIHSIAQQRAASNISEQQSGFWGTIVGALTPDAIQQRVLQAATARIENEMVGRDRAAGRDPDAPLRLAPDTTVSLSPASIAAIGTAAANASPQGAAHAAQKARGEAQARQNRT